MGGYGKQSDGGVLSNCCAFEDCRMILHTPLCLPDTSDPKLPYVVLGDEVFPLRNYLLRPFPGKNLPGNLCFPCKIGIYIFMSFHLNAADQTIFNYRLSRARRMIENTFGILA